MAIAASDLVMRLSGGSGNTDPNASLGGAKSSTAVTDNTLNNVWDNVSGDETTAGDTEYRCVYVHNGHGSLTAYSTKIWIDTDTTSTSTAIYLGLGSSAVNGTEQTVANESTAPSSVSFTQPGVGTELSIGDVPFGQHKAVWIKRIVTAGGSAQDADTYILKVNCDTKQ